MLLDFEKTGIEEVVVKLVQKGCLLDRPYLGLKDEDRVIDLAMTVSILPVFYVDHLSPVLENKLRRFVTLNLNTLAMYWDKEICKETLLEKLVKYASPPPLDRVPRSFKNANFIFNFCIENRIISSAELQEKQAKYWLKIKENRLWLDDLFWRGVRIVCGEEKLPKDYDPVDGHERLPFGTGHLIQLGLAPPFDVSGKYWYKFDQHILIQWWGYERYCEYLHSAR
jgi:hypothetical protein